MKRLLVWIVTIVIVASIAGAGLYTWRKRGERTPAAIGATSSAANMPGMPMPAATEKTSAGAAATPRGDVTVDPRRQQLIGIRTVAVVRSPIENVIRAVGTVRYDETRLSDVNLKVEGWIRDLYVDFTGQAIRRSQPLFALYSPELLATENEYLVALRTREQLQQSQVADARTNAEQLVASARRRLALWDLPEEEIRALETSRTAQSSVVFRAPVAGVVIEKQALQGMHVMPGQSLYKIADLSTIWLEADVYENDVPAVRVGSTATVTIDAYPAARFAGRVIYVYPYVEEKTRTNKVRFEFPNRGGRLKPGMYANVELRAGSGIGLTVPGDAVLDSGKEQIVFVAKGDGYFEPRRVRTGRQFDDRIQILDGVKDGEQVATGATFFLDSESQLRASLQGYETPSPGSGHPAVPQQLEITFHSIPDPPKAGENQFEVTLKDAVGKPMDGADVTVQFFMPAMPTMNMPAMRNEVKLSGAGGGMYRGTGQVMMAGRWDTTVTVSRGGQRIGSKQVTVVAR